MTDGYTKISSQPSALHSGLTDLHTKVVNLKKYDNQVVSSPTTTSKGFPGPYNGRPMHTKGGKKNYIYCPKTLNKFSLNSKKGKTILNNYISHCRINNKKSNCLYSKIYNEKTGRMVSIYGNIGKNIIKNL